MSWSFREIMPDEVEAEITQRDQFRNDKVDLSDTIVRESIQNSLDAGNGGVVRVRVSKRDKSNGLEPEFLKNIFVGQMGHAKDSGVDVGKIDFSEPTALVIEDFGTSGLTGETKTKDSKPFSAFWRWHGKSPKAGANRGRWGLGKIVFSMSSELGAFFGVTVRAEDSEYRYLMGQTVLSYHTTGDVKYAPHGFYARKEKEKAIPQPFIENDILLGFEKNFVLQRGNSPGLSIIIPFPADDINIDSMISVSIVNYYYAILSGQLILDFDGLVVDSSTIRQISKQYADGKITDAEKVFDFIEEINKLSDSEFFVPNKFWYKNGKLDGSHFDESDLAEMSDKFDKQELVAVKLNIPIEIKEKGIQAAEFKIFLKAPLPLTKGHDMYIRSGLTLPGEAKFQYRKSLGALIASTDAIAGFLGDAENAAHTEWNSKAEKLKKYVSAYDRLKAIRNSLRDLYDVIDKAAEEVEEEALKDFFWSPTDKKAKAPKGKVSPPKPAEPLPPPKSKPFQIKPCLGGFELSPKDIIPATDFPVKGWVKIAYDLVDLDPFANFNPLDFNLSDKTEFTVLGENVNFSIDGPNIIAFTIVNSAFKLKVTGFDAERDISVKAKIED